MPSGWDVPEVGGGRIGKVLRAAEQRYTRRIEQERVEEIRLRKRYEKQQKREKRKKEKELQKQKAAKSGGSLLFSVATFGMLVLEKDQNKADESKSKNGKSTKSDSGSDETTASDSSDPGSEFDSETCSDSDRDVGDVETLSDSDSALELERPV